MNTTECQNTPFNGCCVAPNFNGLNSFIDLGNPANMNFNGKITIEAWVYVRFTNGLRNIFAHGFRFNPNAEVALRIADGSYQVGSWNGSNHYASFKIPSSDINNWVHLAGVYDGMQWIMYRNGIQVSTQASSVGSIAMDAPWSIGANGGGSERFFDGQLRNVAIWNTARTAAEINIDMWEYPASDDSSLQGYWDISSGFGTVANDLSYFQNPGTMNHIAWYNMPMQVTDTLVFGGSGTKAYVSIGNPSALNIAGSITLMAWIYPVATDGIRNIIAHGYTLNPNAEVYFRVINGKYQVGSWNGSDHYTQYPIDNADINNWVHLAGVYDGKNWILYKNGVKVASSASGTGAITVNAPWAIGSRGDGSERFFEGFIARAGIFNRGLSATDIQTCISQPQFAAGNAVAYWPMGEGAGSTTMDRTANKLDGTTVNCIWVVTGGAPGWILLNTNGGFSSLNNGVAATDGATIWAYAGQYQQTVYSSVDMGYSWQNIQPAAPWPGRKGASGTYYRNYLWLMGGEQSACYNDVWNSEDGVTWDKVLNAAPWPARQGACLVVFNGMMWLFGGNDLNGNVYNDVWNSWDGKTWRKVTTAAQWSKRDSAAAAVFNGKVWIMGGAYGGNSIQDAWSSTDGINWKQAPVPPWPSRFLASAIVINSTLYLTGGVNTATRDLNDMWATNDGNSWAQLTANAPWSKREQQAVTGFQGRIILAGGITSGLQSATDVWRFTPRLE